MTKRPRVTATPAEAIALILRGTPACWISSPKSISLPDLTDEKARKKIKVDPSVLGNVAASKGWLGIPAPRANGKLPRLTPQQRVAKQLTEAMQAVAKQAVEQARTAGLKGETAMMVAAIDAAQRGLLAGLVAVQGTLVAPPAKAAEEHRRGRKAKADVIKGGKASRRRPNITDEQAIEASRAVHKMLARMSKEERATVDSLREREMLVEEIEAMTGHRYQPESAYRRVNRVYNTNPKTVSKKRER
jgi:hypothetical protein